MNRSILALLLFSLLPICALAQTGNVDTKTQLTTDITTNWADNSSGLITPLIARQTLLNAVVSYQQAPRVNAQTGTTYTVVADDYGKLVTFSNTSAVAVTVPQATTTFATFSFFTCNKNTGTVTFTPTTSTVNGNATFVSTIGQCSLWVSDGTNWQAMTFPSGTNSNGGQKAPTVQNLTTGTDQTYTTPAGDTWIEITLVGGGGGGGGGGSSGGAGTTGNATCWKTTGTACSTPLYQAGGGTNGTGSSGAFGTGGTVSGSGTCDFGVVGGNGGGGGIATASGGQSGGTGGNTTLGGGGGSQAGASAGGAGSTNTGGGGGGGGAGLSSVVSGTGGGGGATCRVNIASPAATYVYTIAATANGGSAGTTGGAGGAGAAGRIIVVEHYGP
jgi:hypothetical protein